MPVRRNIACAALVLFVLVPVLVLVVTALKVVGLSGNFFCIRTPSSCGSRAQSCAPPEVKSWRRHCVCRPMLYNTQHSQSQQHPLWVKQDSGLSSQGLDMSSQIPFGYRSACLYQYPEI